MVENLEGEIWKPVVGYAGKYEVSNKGRMKSLNYKRTHKERIMKLYNHPNGYVLVDLRRNGVREKRRVHRLVYESFVGKLPEWIATAKGDERMEINHIDENPLNNCVENLELVTCTYNNNYGSHIRRGALKQAFTVYQYTKDLELVKIWESVNECQRNGYNSRGVYQSCRNKFHKEGNNVYRGFIWSYTPLKKEDTDV